MGEVGGAEGLQSLGFWKGMRKGISGVCCENDGVGSGRGASSFWWWGGVGLPETTLPYGRVSDCRWVKLKRRSSTVAFRICYRVIFFLCRGTFRRSRRGIGGCGIWMGLWSRGIGVGFRLGVVGGGGDVLGFEEDVVEAALGEFVAGRWPAARRCPCRYPPRPAAGFRRRCPGRGGSPGRGRVGRTCRVWRRRRR